MDVWKQRWSFHAISCHIYYRPIQYITNLYSAKIVERIWGAGTGWLAGWNIWDFSWLTFEGWLFVKRADICRQWVFTDHGWLIAGLDNHGRSQIMLVAYMFPKAVVGLNVNCWKLTFTTKLFFALLLLWRNTDSWRKPCTHLAAINCTEVRLIS